MIGIQEKGIGCWEVSVRREEYGDYRLGMAGPVGDGGER